MKTMKFCALTLAALTTACASDKPSEGTVPSDELSVQVAMYGLTVVDCQQQATQCYRDDRRAVGCSTKLARCLSRAGAEVAKGIVAETHDILACGKSGVQCVGDATRLSAVLSCEDKVESCVLSSVNDLTGIPLPTSQHVAADAVATTGHVLETAGEIVHTGVDVTEHVLDTALDTTHEVVDSALDTTHEVVHTAVHVSSEVVAHTLEVSEEVLETAHEVTSTVAETATTVVSDVVDTGLQAGKTALQCGEESRACIRTSKKLLSCQLAYAECLSNAL